MKTLYIRYLFLLLFVFLFTACSNRSSDENNLNNPDNNDTTIKSANFLDSAVIGIKYTCSNSSTEGFTNENGTFDYDENCGTITFKIGGVSVYSKAVANIPADKQLYITDLVGVDRTDTNNSKVLDIARFLQSLDDDNNPYNGINITPAVSNELSDSTIDFANNPSIADLNSTITNLGRVLVDEDDAQV